jgi:hypothetical protein
MRLPHWLVRARYERAFQNVEVKRQATRKGERAYRIGYAIGFAVLYAYWWLRLTIPFMIREGFGWAMVMVIAGSVIAMSGLASHRLLSMIYG